MASGLSTILYPVSDLAQAKALFTQFLGVEPATDSPYDVGFEVDGQQIGLVPNGNRSDMSGPVCYRLVDDIEASLRLLLDTGAQLQQAVKGVGGGRRVASVKDGDGNELGLMQDP
jgi:predicted enzyme related to lactoylglutathione lyase